MLGALAAIAGGSPLPEYAPGRLIVRYRAQGRLGTMAHSMGSWGASVQSVDPALGSAAMSVEDPSQIDRVARDLLRHPDVLWVEPDVVLRAQQMPDDPSFADQYSLRQVLADRAWTASTGDPSIVIAIVDSGIDLDHPDLAHKLVPGVNLVDRRSDPDDDHGHGTQVAGIAAASTNNGLGIAGVGYSCSIMPVKALRSDGSGLTSTVASGIVWAVDHGAKVVALSLGSSAPSRTLADAVGYAWSRGALVVAAAGNSGSGEPFYPAAYPTVLSVGATDRNGQRASFSNYGSWVDVASPGLGILSTTAGGGYGVLSGTSASCPMVAGLAGLVWAVLGPTSNPAAVQRRIAEGCDAAGNWLAGGQVNAAASVEPSLLWEPALKLGNASVTGGRTTIATLSIDKPAPSGGAVFLVEPSSNAAVLPRAVRIPPGCRAKAFSVRTKAVAEPVAVEIVASCGAARSEAVLVVEPAALRELALGSRRVKAGQRVTATLRLTGPAPASGTSVQIESSDCSLVPVPATVTVAPGRSYAVFSFRAGTPGADAEATLTATLLPARKDARIRITP